MHINTKDLLMKAFRVLFLLSLRRYYPVQVLQV